MTGSFLHNFGSTLAFSKAQARKMLDAPAEDTIARLRDRAILSVGLRRGNNPNFGLRFLSHERDLRRN
jgi:hypothetical protein